jgi:hypothetical protein
MTGKGDRNRTTDRLSYENNWDEIFGKKPTQEDLFEEIIPTVSGEDAFVGLNDNLPDTLESLSQHPSDGWDDEIAKRMREWAIMMDFLRTLKYEDYPVQAAEKLYNSFK